MANSRGVALLFSLLLLLGGRALSAPSAVANLSPSELYFISLNASRNEEAAIAPGVWLLGQTQLDVSAATAEACARECLAREACSWFNWCGQEDKCPSSGKACRLMSSNCTLVPVVEQRLGGSAQVTAGFPIREMPLELPGFTAAVAQGMEGSDFECAGSMLPDMCAFSSPINAAAICSVMVDCRAVMVYANGTDDCSGELAVLKSSGPAPGTTFVSPSTYVMQTVESAALSTVFLIAGEARILPPDPGSAAAAELAETGVSSSSVSSNSSSNSSLYGVQGLANSTAWLGCIVAENALMSGEVVEVVDNVATAEECCRLCRQTPDCNVFNMCLPGEATCSYRDRATEVVLREGQCELRYQDLVDPEFGWPPAVIAKGSDIPFTGGSPTAVLGPPVEGFDMQLGGGLFGQPGFNCPGTLKPELQECVLSMPLPELAGYCLQDAECQAFVYKPAGIYLSPGDVAYFRHEEGANANKLVHTPSSVLYFRIQEGSGDSGASGLTAAAIAGIAIGAAAVAAAVAAAGWVLLRRRRRRQLGQAQVQAPSTETDSRYTKSDQKGSSLEEGRGAAGSLDSCSPPATQGFATSSRSTTGGLSRASPMGPLPVAAVLKAAHVTAMKAAELPAAAAALAAGAPSSLRAISPQARAAPAPAPTVAWPPPVRAADRKASPFAAASVRRSLDSESRPSQPIPQKPRLPRTPDSLGVPQMSAAMAELAQEVLQYRAAREAGGTAPPAGDSTITAGTAATDNAGGDTQDSGTSTPSQLVAAGLPASLQEYLIPPASFEYVCGPKGEPVLLGEGASGKVYKALWNGEVIAAKTVQLDRSPEAQEAFVTEAVRLQMLRHPHVVGFFGVSLDNYRGVILMEYCSGHDLFSVLKLQKTATQLRLLSWHRHGCRVAYEVACALNFLHSRGVVHMDIKSQNVLLTSQGVAKLADVGVSRLLKTTFLSQASPVGTFAWVAPEVLMGMSCSQAVDLFSFGVLAWEIITEPAALAAPQMVMPWLSRRTMME